MQFLYDKLMLNKDAPVELQSILTASWLVEVDNQYQARNLLSLSAINGLHLSLFFHDATETFVTYQS